MEQSHRLVLRQFFKFIKRNHPPLPEQSLVDFGNIRIESADHLDVEVVAKQPICDLQNGGHDGFILRLLAAHDDRLRILNDEDGILLFDEEGDEVWFQLEARQLYFTVK